MREPIAIIGIGCRFPGQVTSPASFWRLLVDGVDTIREIPPERFDLEDLFDSDPAVAGKIYSRWGAFVDGIDQFDPGFFGFSRREAIRIDPQHRMLLETAWEALEDAHLPADRVAGSATGVFVGISTHDYPDMQAYPGNRALIDAHTNSGGAVSIASNRISYVYDLRGPSFSVDTACSSSLVATHLACQSLWNGECDLALVGGVQAVLTPEVSIGFCKASMLSPDGRCKAFAAEANGYVRGEGGGMLVLKPLSRARADGDRIYALVRGSAINEDGRTNGMTVPSLAAQQSVLRDAYRRAGVRPEAVHYVEAHGTGTVVGDPIEAEALGSVLGVRSPGRPGAAHRLGEDEYRPPRSRLGHRGIDQGGADASPPVDPPSLHARNLNPAIAFADLHLRVVGAGEAWPDGTPPARRNQLVRLRRSQRARHSRGARDGRGGARRRPARHRGTARRAIGAARDIREEPGVAATAGAGVSRDPDRRRPRAAVRPVRRSRARAHAPRLPPGRRRPRPRDGRRPPRRVRQRRDARRCRHRSRAARPRRARRVRLYRHGPAVVGHGALAPDERAGVPRGDRRMRRAVPPVTRRGRSSTS